MKIDLHQPALATIAAESATSMETARGFAFKPFASPALWENRIDVSTRPAPARKSYPFKRADEAVN